MKIEAVDIVQMRNMPIPRKGKKRLPVPDHGVSTIVQVHMSDGVSNRETGLGEIRALGALTGETPNDAYVFAYRLAAELIGKSLPDGLSGRDAAKASHDLIVATTKSASGIETENDLPDDLHPSVCLAFDCAILDAMARLAGTSVVAFLGCAPAPVNRNVIARSFSQPNSLLNSLLQGSRPAGWLRGAYSKDGMNLATLVGAVAAATGGRDDELKGLCFNLNGQWTLEALAPLLAGLNDIAAIRGSGLEIVLEQPFPTHATAWYREALATIEDSDPAVRDRIRVMIGDDLGSTAALEPLKDMLPRFDLKITPQKCGSLHAVFSLLERARELGFAGRVYLGNAGMNTELNSLMLATLALLIDDDVQFSAGHKRETGANIRQVWPQLSVDEDLPMVLRLPEGSGWGAELCKSGLEKRLRKCGFLRPASVAVDPETLMAQVIDRAYDDSAMNVHVLDAEFEDDDGEGVDDTDALGMYGYAETDDSTDRSSETGR